MYVIFDNQLISQTDVQKFAKPGKNDNCELWRKSAPQVGKET
jgi:hypothetical protein